MNVSSVLLGGGGYNCITSISISNMFLIGGIGLVATLPSPLHYGSPITSAILRFALQCVRLKT